MSDKFFLTYKVLGKTTNLLEVKNLLFKECRDINIVGEKIYFTKSNIPTLNSNESDIEQLIDDHLRNYSERFEEIKKMLKNDLLLTYYAEDIVNQILIEINISSVQMTHNLEIYFKLNIPDHCDDSLYDCIDFYIGKFINEFLSYFKIHQVGEIIKTLIGNN